MLIINSFSFAKKYSSSARDDSWMISWLLVLDPPDFHKHYHLSEISELKYNYVLVETVENLNVYVAVILLTISSKVV